MGFIEDFMYKYFDEIEPKEFYTEIFPTESMGELGKLEETGNFNGVAVELKLKPKEIYEAELAAANNDYKKVKKYYAKNFFITGDLFIMDRLLESEEFIIVSPITYIGKSRAAKNARYIHALAIDLDGVDTEDHLYDLFHQIENEILPKPTFIVCSGNGIHLYYQFKDSVRCYEKTMSELGVIKTALTKKIWNRYTTSEYNKPQYQSIYQGFRLVGGVTKNGSRTRAFITGDRVSIDYLNEFVKDDEKVKNYVYRERIKLEKAKELYPQWYKERIVEGKPVEGWQNSMYLYLWWYRKLLNEITEGHRYNGILVLAAMARKCRVPFSILERDAFGLLERMEMLTVKEDNHFTESDVQSAIQYYYDKDAVKMSIENIREKTKIDIKKTKRNFRSRAKHIKTMNFIRDEVLELDWRNKDGAPTKGHIVEAWQKENPGGTKYRCIKETGLSKNTVYKYWKDS